MTTINQERFLSLLDEQATIGATPEGGLSRPALSEADMAIRAWFKQQVQSAGLDYRRDSAGNQFARLPADDPSAKALLIGSHLDSVPDGGRYDGALGVLSAFEAVLSLRDSGQSLPFHVDVVNFTDEEGTHQGLLGSSAFTGQLTPQALESPRSGRDALSAGLARAGLTEDGLLSAASPAEALLGYIEVHIEQGTRLESANQAIGVVSHIVGIRSNWLTFKGEAAHAGTMPMTDRRDALQGAAEFIRQARELVMRDFHPGVVNFGRISLAPGAFNIVPAEVRLAMEFRHGDLSVFDEMETALHALAHRVAEDCKLELTLESAHAVTPAPMSEHLIEIVESASDRAGLSHTRLMSFAGHDAQALARMTDSVMYFVPSVDGISHNPQEFTRPQDCINAATVMLNSVLLLAEQHGD